MKYKDKETSTNNQITFSTFSSTSDKICPLKVSLTDNAHIVRASLLAISIEGVRDNLDEIL